MLKSFDFTEKDINAIYIPNDEYDFFSYSSGIDTTDYMQQLLSTTPLKDNEKSKEIIVNAYHNQIKNNSTSSSLLDFKVNIKNKDYSIELRISSDDYYYLISEVYKTEEFKKQILTLPDINNRDLFIEVYNGFVGEDLNKKEMYKIFCEEYEKLSYEKCLKVNNTYSYNQIFDMEVNETKNAYAAISLIYPFEGTYCRRDIEINFIDFPKTTQYLIDSNKEAFKKIYAQIYTLKNSNQKFTAHITDLKTGERFSIESGDINQEELIEDFFDCINTTDIDLNINKNLYRVYLNSGVPNNMSYNFIIASDKKLN